MENMSILLTLAEAGVLLAGSLGGWDLRLKRLNMDLIIPRLGLNTE